jgi:hypothetical protein
MWTDVSEEDGNIHNYRSENLKAHYEISPRTEQSVTSLS